jgi:hypothetical protein
MEYPLPTPLALRAARRPIVEKLVAAADASGNWYDRFPEHMRLAPREFAWSYIQRSGRIDPAGSGKFPPNSSMVESQDRNALPTTLVGSYPQPEWLIDRKKLAGASRRACARESFGGSKNPS